MYVAIRLCLCVYTDSTITAVEYSSRINHGSVRVRRTRESYYGQSGAWVSASFHSVALRTRQCENWHTTVTVNEDFLKLQGHLALCSFKPLIVCSVHTHG